MVTAGNIGHPRQVARAQRRETWRTPISVGAHTPRPHEPPLAGVLANRRSAHRETPHLKGLWFTLTARSFLSGHNRGFGGSMSRLRAIWLAYLRAGTSVATRKLTKPSQDGLVAIGAVTATLGDGSAVTNCWYRFADQPALLNADLTKEEPEAMQVRVEKLHRACTKDREYLAPPTVGTLAYLDPAQLVQPPKGFEVGYVPIAVR